MELFKLFGTIAVDNAKANRSIDETSDKAKGAGNSLNDLAEEGEKSGSKLGGALKKVGSGAIAVGKTIASGLAVGAAAFTGLTMKALSLGGELEQNMGGSEAVFKDYAGKMQETAKQAFKNMGLATSDYLATANKMGALFQGAGFTIEESADISSRAMQRAADVASIMGISTESAMEAIAGAAKGNFTMMDNLGVAMNDTTLQAYALSKGIEKSTSEMTNQEKIGLAMEMFLEKTEYAAGNYAKENETLAGSLATAKAALTNFLDGSGDVDSLVDSFVNAANVIVNSLNKILPRLVKGISDLITKLVPQLPPLLQTLLPAVIEGAVSLVNGLVEALPTILNALIDALPAFIDGIQKVFDALVKALPTIMRTLCDALPILIPQLVDALIGMLVTLMTMLPQIIQPIIDNLPEIIISIVDALMQNLPLLIEGLVALVIGIVQAIPQIIMALIEALPTVITSILEGLWNALPVFLQGLVSIYGNIGQALWDIVSGIWHGLGGIFSGVGEWFSTNIGEPIKNVFSGAWNALKNGASNAWNGIKNVFGSVADWFKNIFSKAWQAVKNVFSTGGKIFDGIKDGIVNAFKTVVNAIIKGINKVIAVPFNAINKLLSKLKSIDILGVKPFGWINTFNVPQIPLLRKGGVLKKGQTGFLEGDGDEAVVPLEKNTGWIRNVAERIHQFVNIDTKTKVDNSVPTNQIATVIRTEIGLRIGNLENLVANVIAVLQEYFPQLLEAFDVQMVLNDGTLVAKLTPKIDRELGMILQRKKRGMD